MQKKRFFVLLCLLVMSLIVIISCVGERTTEYITRDLPSTFDWNLPVATSAGIEPDQLAYLTDDEIRLLHQPYVDIANSISAEFGVNVEIGTIDCYFMTRDDIIYTITNVSLAEMDLGLRELGDQLRRMTYVSKVFETIQESDYDYMLAVLIDAFDHGALDPVEVYYRIQQDGITSFFKEIQDILR
ncbi:MAG: hypothetical protein FWE11_06085 [Defluviitaleaceae bacterium]|nr:hypothetical protein [Defluviitaleaceae bacterium]